MKKILASFFSVLGIAAAQGNYLSVAPPQKVVAKRGGTAEAQIDVRLMSGFHVNTDKPEDEYLIPLRLRWLPGPLSAVEIVYPKGEMKRYAFSEKPLSVFTDKFRIITRFKVDAAAPVGPGVLNGKLRYQACTEDRCFPPKTADVKLPYTIR